MKNDPFLDASQIVAKIEKLDGVSYALVHGKQIIFHATLPNGITKCICTPKSRFQASINGYWVDITSVQKDLLDRYGCSYVIFRLEDMRYSVVDWKEISPLLTSSCMQNNDREGDHWKMYIRKGFLEVRKGEKIPINVEQM